MSADLPHTLYKKKNKASDIDDAEQKTREAMERKKREREKAGQYTVEEVFAGEADAGEQET